MIFPDFNDRPDLTQRLDDLLQRYFDHEMTEEECRELLDLWNKHPDCETRLSYLYKTEHLLRFAAAIKTKDFPSSIEISRLPSLQDIDLDRLVHQERESSPIIRAKESIPEAKMPLPPRSVYRKESKSPTRGFLLAVLVLGLFLTAVYWEFKPSMSPGPAPFHPTGEVRASIDVRWPDGVEPLKPGQSVTMDRIRFEEGLLELELKNGIRLALEGPIDFKINSVMSAFCGRGRLSASVPKQGKGFTVSTPFNDMTDLGTEFYLDVEDEKVQTHTITGLVSLGKLPNNTNKDLPGGNAFSIDIHGSMNDFPADASLFRDEKTVQKLFDTVQRREQTAWEKRLSTYRDDPGLVLLFDFEEAGKRVVNRIARTNHGGDGTLHEARRSTGRWKDKGAVAFQDRNAAIDIRIPGEFQSLTLAASVRVEALDRFVHCLLAGSEDNLGTVFWQLGSNGVLTLAVQDDANIPAVKYPSVPIISRKQCGAWFHLATVVDAQRRTVSHYLDGKLVNVIPITKPMPIRIDEARIGNAIRNVPTLIDCSFRGRIDEFLIFDRALSADEISLYFNPPAL